ncbi:MAG: hypothetical protein MUP98_20580 [Candidatus Aminicenantes bacterium]|nr:hypothetical protein [Candidatus Aminicenantes bacterium]
MKIDQMEIAKIIKIPSLEPFSKTKISCPSPKKLIALLRLELSEQKRRNVIDHLEGCSTCVQEIKFINEILTAEKNFDKETSHIIAQKNQTSLKKRIFVKFPFQKLACSSKSVAAVLTIIILSASMIFLFKTNKPAVERSSILQLEHISPNDKSLSLSELIFQWEKIPDFDYYTVEIFDDSLNLVWRSERIIENKIIPTTELKELLKKDTTYSWMVTSFLKNGKQIESPLAKFNLK